MHKRQRICTIGYRYGGVLTMVQTGDFKTQIGRTEKIKQPCLVNASDSCEQGDLAWEAVQALLEQVKRCDWLVKTLIHLVVFDVRKTDSQQSIN